MSATRPQYDSEDPYSYDEDVDDDDDESSLGDDEPDDREEYGQNPNPYARIAQDARADASAFQAISQNSQPQIVQQPLRSQPTPPVYVQNHEPPRLSQQTSTPQRGPVLPLPHERRATPQPNEPPRRAGGLSYILRALSVFCEGLCGVWELACVAVSAMRDALSIDAQYSPREDSPASSAVRGKLLAIVVLQQLLLGVQLGLVGAVGMTGELAEVVHMQYVTAQAASIASVLLGTYVYVFGAVDPSQRRGDRVYSLYLVVELASVAGGSVNFMRFAMAYDDRHHLAAAISPVSVADQSEWNHGVCGQPHFIGAFMLLASASWVVLSGLNAIALTGRHRPKVKDVDPPPATKPQADPAHVRVDMRDPREYREMADDDEYENYGNDYHNPRPPRRRAARSMAPVNSVNAVPPRTVASMTTQPHRPGPPPGLDMDNITMSVIINDD